MSTKLRLLRLAVIVLSTATLISIPFNTALKRTVGERLAIQEYIDHHPYSLRPHMDKSELKKIPKYDRPDLANEQNFMMTLDPALGYPPPDGLIKAYEATEVQRNNQMLFKGISGVTWSERGPSNVGGRTRAVMFDPNDGTNKKVWAGGVAGGLWHCSDITLSTSTWTKVDDFWDNMAITSMAYDANSTQTFYVGTGEGFFNSDAVRGGGIWKSTNGGTSFARLASTNNSNFRYVQKIEVHPTSSDVYAATHTGVWRSQNGGTNWTQVLGIGKGSTTNRMADIEIAADGKIYVAAGIFSTDGIYSSTTGNASSWTKLNGGVSGFPDTDIRRIELACAPSAAGTIYAVAQNGGTAIKGIYKSTNSGSTWTSLSLPNDADDGIPDGDFTRGQAWYDLIMSVHPTNPATVYIGGVDLFKTTNSGSSWSQIAHWYGGFGFPEVHADQHAIEFRPGSPNEVVFGTDGGVYYTSNGGTTYNNMNNSYNVTQFYSCAIHPTTATNYYLAGSQDNGTHQFDAAGIDETREVTGGDGAFCFIDQTDATYQVTSYVYNNWRRSINGGTSFSAITNDNSGRFINPADYDDQLDIIYSANNSTTIKRTTGISSPSVAESSIGVSIGGSSPASHIRVSPYSPVGTTTLFVGSGVGKVFKVTNAHSSPVTTDITGNLPSGYISCIEVGASDNQLLVTYSSYGVISVWETTNGGGTWVNKEGDLPDMPIRWALYNPDDRSQVMLATEVGVWSTDDLSASPVDWDATNGGLANCRVDMLQMRASGDKQVIAATHGRGLYSSSFPIGAAPTADFSGSPTSAAVGATVTFTNASSGSITSYAWDFGTNATPATATGAGPHDVTYSTSGQKTVELTVTGPGGNDTETKSNYITVIDAPTADFTASTTSTQTGQTVTFTNTSTGDLTGASYAWDFGAGALPATATGAGPHNVTYSTTGLKTVELAITGAPGGNDTETKSNYVNINNVPTTKLRTSYCGQTFNTLLTRVYSDHVPGASAYIFRFVHAASGFDQEISNISDWMPLHVIGGGGLAHGKTYEVTVKAVMGSDTGSYSTACNITISGALPTTQLRASHCGQTYNNLSTNIFCDYVPGANKYIFRFVHAASGFDETVSHIRDWYPLWAVGGGGLEFGKTYEVTVKVVMGSDTSAYGAACNVTIGAALPTTQLRASHCGQTYNNLSTNIFCNYVPGATNYIFRFVHAGSGFDETVSNVRDWYPLWAVSGGGLEYGKTYEVTVKVVMGSDTSAYGAACNVTISGTLPTTKLKTSHCGHTFNSLTVNAFCDHIPGATKYIFRFVHAGSGFDETVTHINNWYPLWAIGENGLQDGNTYDVTVRAVLSSGDTTDAGAVCTVTIDLPLANYDDPGDDAPQSADFTTDIEEDFDDFISSEPKISLYPNPTDGMDVNLKLEGVHDRAVVSIFDLSGKRVMYRTLANPKGMPVNEKLFIPNTVQQGFYVVNITFGDETVVKRLLIK